MFIINAMIYLDLFSCYLRSICTARPHRTCLSLTLTIMWGGYPVGPGPIDVRAEWCVVRCHYWLDSPWCNLLYYKAYCSYLTIYVETHLISGLINHLNFLRLHSSCLTPYGFPRRIRTTTLRRSVGFTIQLIIFKLTRFKSMCSPLSNAEDQALISVLVFE